MAPALLRPVLAAVALASALGACRATDGAASPQGAGMFVHYLEIVTPDVDATCAALAAAHGATFGAPVPELGQARTADLGAGGRVGVRAPMATHEEPVVRPYVLVDDIVAAVAAAEASGAQVALPPTEIAGQGTIAIYFLGGIQHGLWQL